MVGSVEISTGIPDDRVPWLKSAREQYIGLSGNISINERYFHVCKISILDLDISDK